jgi:hypothetical protein
MAKRWRTCAMARSTVSLALLLATLHQSIWTLKAIAENGATSLSPKPSPTSKATPAASKSSPLQRSTGTTPASIPLRTKLRDRLFGNGSTGCGWSNQFSLRNYYFNYKNGEFRNNVLFRVDEAPRDNLSVAAELTIATAYKGRKHYSGTGDSYVEALYTPWRNNYLALTLGGATIIPTASSANLGAGKWQLAPILTPTFYPLGDSRLVTYVEFRNFVSIANVGRYNFISVAGDSPFSEAEGSFINYLEMRPVIRYTISDSWYLYAEPVFTTINWANHDALSYRSAIRLAHMLTDRVGIWVQPEAPFGSNRSGDFNIKTAIFYRY